MNRPNSPQVAVTWLRTLDLEADGIDTALPGDPATWAANGYLQVPTTVGGSPAVHVPVRAPLVQVSAWGTRLNSEQVPWNRTEHLLASVLDAAFEQRSGVDLDMPAGYQPVRLLSVWAASEPRRIPGDPSGYAHVTADLQMRWVVLE